jgi:hypothetical protein
MKQWTRLTAATIVALVSLALAACSGGSNTGTATVATSNSHGTLIDTPPLRIASLNAADFAAELGASAAGAQLLQASGAPVCGVDFYYLQYWTLDGGQQPAPTTASGALMVPTGGAGCTGPRPIVLYAHGTTTDKSYNIANIADPTNPAYSESALIAAMYAAQGFIVVAPNYAGYDSSSLSYHPYLNANQQAGEMIDALTAARTALPKTFASATTDSGKLLLTGYSQGGYVALATMRALEAAHQSVTAAAPGSGPYALEAFGDLIFTGAVDLGSVVFAPLLTTSYQHAYGNIYSATTDIYSATYASGIDTLLPSTQSLSTIFTNNLLPQTALFDSTTPTINDLANASVPAPYQATLAAVMSVPTNPLFASGFGSPYLINNAYRINYVLDAASNPDNAFTPSWGLAATPPSINTFRKALYLNDLRQGPWLPSAPLLMCGGVNDPTVFFANSIIMGNYFAATAAADSINLPPNLITVLSVDPAGSNAPPTLLQQAFLGEEAAVSAAAGGGPAGQLAVIESYHGTLVPPLCAVAARGFFLQVLGGAG